MIIDSFIDRFQKFYYKDDYVESDYKAIMGEDTRPLLSVSRNIERLLFGESDTITYSQVELKHLAWKSGRISTKRSDIIIAKNDEETFYWDKRNTYGRLIEGDIGAFLARINESDMRERLLDGDISGALMKIMECRADDIKYIGMVYYFTLMYFASGYRYPIYDVFSHTAVKALCYNKNPRDVYVGTGPDKGTGLFVFKAVGMYEEYLGMLNHLFGTYSISRSLDRALWVYGHSQIKY